MAVLRSIKGSIKGPVTVFMRLVFFKVAIYIFHNALVGNDDARLDVSYFV